MQLQTRFPRINTSFLPRHSFQSLTPPTPPPRPNLPPPPPPLLSHPWLFEWADCCYRCLAGLRPGSSADDDDEPDRSYVNVTTQMRPRGRRVPGTKERPGFFFFLLVNLINGVFLDHRGGRRPQIELVRLRTRNWTEDETKNTEPAGGRSCPWSSWN